MKFNELALEDKVLFNKFLQIRIHGLCVYAFANIFIWKDLFKISWIILENNLCIFFKGDSGVFMYLAPLGPRQSRSLIVKCFEIMDSLNPNRDISRIENVEKEHLDLFRSFGYEVVLKSSEYICKRDDLAFLRGDKFKSKRWAYNYFIKNYRFRYEPFCLSYTDECMDLCRSWINNRKRAFDDPVYQYMLEDSFNSQQAAFYNYRALSLIGRVVKVDGQIKGYSLGFRLNKDTFCILFEVTELSIRGISQFIFRQFSDELKDYKYINIMDDSGLDNLNRVKLSYRPIRSVPSYIIKRK